MAITYFQGLKYIIPCFFWTLGFCWKVWYCFDLWSDTFLFQFLILFLGFWLCVGTGSSLAMPLCGYKCLLWLVIYFAKVWEIFWHKLIGFLMFLVSFLIFFFLSFCKSQLFFLCHGCLHSNLWSCPRVKSVMVLFVHYWNLNMLHYFSTFSSSLDTVTSVWPSLLMIVSLLIFALMDQIFCFQQVGGKSEIL